MTDKVRELLDTKEEAYGKAWKLATLCLRERNVLKAFIHFVVTAPEYVHNWVIIMSKMMRILSTPRDPEHWLDIAGYATLVVEDLKPKQPTNPTPTPKEN